MKRFMFLSNYRETKYLLGVLVSYRMFLFSVGLSSSCNSLHNVAISLSMSSMERSLLNEYLVPVFVALQINGHDKKVCMILPGTFAS